MTRIFYGKGYTVTLDEGPDGLSISSTGILPKGVKAAVAEMQNALPRPSLSMAECCLRGLFKKK